MGKIAAYAGPLNDEDGRVEFSVQATLGYRVQKETPFVFNVQAQAFTGQTIKSETLRIEPELPTEDWTMPESANRYFRVIAPAGGFKITYTATVLLSQPTENPLEVFEVSPGELPLSVLTSTPIQAGIASRIVSSALRNGPLGNCRQGISALRRCVIGFATMSITSASPAEFTHPSGDAHAGFARLLLDTECKNHAHAVGKDHLPGGITG